MFNVEVEINLDYLFTVGRLDQMLLKLKKAFRQSGEYKG